MAQLKHENQLASCPHPSIAFVMLPAFHPYSSSHSSQPFLVSLYSSHTYRHTCIHYRLLSPVGEGEQAVLVSESESAPLILNQPTRFAPANFIISFLHYIKAHPVHSPHFHYTDPADGHLRWCISLPQ